MGKQIKLLSNLVLIRVQFFHKPCFISVEYSHESVNKLIINKVNAIKPKTNALILKKKN